MIDLSRYLAVKSDEAADPKYFGFLSSSGAWYIMKSTLAAGVTTYSYTKGTSDFDTNWTGRAGLTYASVSEVFA